jgi:uncharacterized membrane protein
MSEDTGGGRAKTAAAVVGGAAAAVAGGKVVQKVVGQAAKLLGADPDQPNRATQSITIDAPPDEVFALLRDPEGIRRIVHGVAEVEPQGQGMHWSIQGMDGESLEWDAVLGEERPGELLRWVPADGASSSVTMEVRLAPAPLGSGTWVTMRLELADAPESPMVGALAGAFVVKTLYRTKALIQTGEVPTLERNPSARPGAGDRI